MGVKTTADPWAPNEMWDLYDKDRNLTGEYMRRGLNIPDGYYHIIVSSWIRNSEGKYLMSLRHPQKKLYGGLWECTGGCAVAGETSLEGAVREANEELGIILDPSTARLIYHTRRDRWQDFYDAFLFASDASIESLNLQDTEVADARWMTKDEIVALDELGKLYPLLSYYRDVLT